MMDTSATYIKMRLAAIPDLGRGQSPWKMTLIPPNAWVDAKGDFYAHDTSGEPHYCQLERQDQLQEMSGLAWWEFDRLCAWFGDTDLIPHAVAETKEQVGIQVVMYELHGKIWVGDIWKVIRV
ncbi:MAG: hypothetical protein KAS32_05160 [Candidatus Peribacteraceae bacterium]|nr:hypothetical protein [Candidatus Peribacteraceae bacterium]